MDKEIACSQLFVIVLRSMELVPSTETTPFVPLFAEEDLASLFLDTTLRYPLPKDVNTHQLIALISQLELLAHTTIATLTTILVPF